MKMEIKCLIVLVIPLLILPDLVSAEMVTLQNCVIDTGTYMLPIDLLGTGKNPAIIPISHLSNGVTEGITWRTSNDQKQSAILVFEANGPVDFESQPGGLKNSLVSMMKPQIAENLTLESVMKPYPGWIESGRVNGTTTIFTGYIGEVSPAIVVSFITTEEPSMAAYILQNLR